MTKYSYTFKRRVVEAYQRDEGTYKTLAIHFGIPVFIQLRNGSKVLRFQILTLKKTNNQTSLFFSIRARCHTLLSK